MLYIIIFIIGIIIGEYIGFKRVWFGNKVSSRPQIRKLKSKILLLEQKIRILKVRKGELTDV